MHQSVLALNSAKPILCRKEKGEKSLRNLTLSFSTKINFTEMRRRVGYGEFCRFVGEELKGEQK